MHSVRVPLVLAVIFLLSACGGSGGDSQSASLAPGERLYNTHCAACHRKDGKGLGTTTPSLIGVPVVAGPVDELVGWVLFGQRPAALPKGVFAGVMPQFQWMSDAEAAEVLTYMRGHFGNTYGAVSVEDVRRVRAARQ
ncbi:MAG: cytochrome c [Gammaproteobacteria bacterium]|nr:cytochrome c [Gammaproteobacteria bacterium]